MAITYTDRSEWPAALRSAEELVKKTVSTYGDDPDGFITIYRKLFLDGYSVRYSNGEADSTYIGDIQLSTEEFIDYKYWWREVMATRRNARRERVAMKLRAKGFYSTDSIGLSLAQKLVEIISMAGDGISSEDMVAFEALMDYRILDGNGADVYLETVKLPAITDSEGTMKLTARRALRNLEKAGILTATGNTSAKRYSLGSTY